MLNYQITFQQVKALAEQGEKTFDAKIGEIADGIIAENPSVLLISGPSGSGKTTCAARLCDLLAKSGKPSSVLSLDDFFIDIKERQNQNPDDLESVDLLDVDMLYYCVNQLISGEPTHIPSFDFSTKHRSFLGKQKLLRQGELLIIEGIHALHPKVLEIFGKISHKALFISVEQSAIFDDGTQIDGETIRMFRRLMRDNLFRGAAPEVTLKLWAAVVAFEKTGIFPYAESADYMIDSYLAYEPFVVRKQLGTVIDAIDANGEFAEFRAKYEPFVKKLCAASKALIPDNSIIHEFIG